ncbi:MULTISPECIES: gene transfer agent family protein [Rhodopseudomonas]|uniref:Gene transfer agent family protein n=1 Tax=Rhodopseudomonas palustris TaxID=1076 RepID=A0A0D7ERA4_RHOPL|nr:MULTISPECIES: gene transfer agent family protein [Rhodopseudomonas]KIZ43095.1 hypothetical protein OO17_11860 [Rhodopseudomonas palustris]MDF3810678.1 gene transfer agent family protein [Rhodopseudomonas sp. BAL398]WOK18470.1 gene transfer agent family protein [Rhodopseudomonas sp. BAL398]
MMTAPHRAFFGDAEYEFRITASLISELERKTNAGIGTLCSRIFARQFTQADINETIRLALIGGGVAPERAASLIASYAVDRSLSETYPLAVAILDALWFGQPHEASNGQT